MVFLMKIFVVEMFIYDLLRKFARNTKKFDCVADIHCSICNTGYGRYH